jgi:hypothetical protein
MIPKGSVVSSNSLFQNLKTQAAELSYYRASRGVLDVPAKVSVEAKAAGMMIRIPIQVGDARAGVGSPRRASRGRSYSGQSFVAPKRPFVRAHSSSDPSHPESRGITAGHYVQLSVGTVTLLAGDYLTLQLQKKPLRRQSARDERPRNESNAPFLDDFVNPESGTPPSADFVYDVDGESPQGVYGEDPYPARRSTMRPSRRQSSYASQRGIPFAADEGQEEEEAEEMPAITTEEKIREIVLALKNAAARPMAFSVAAVELCIFDRDLRRGTSMEETASVPAEQKASFNLHKVFSAVNETPAPESEPKKPTDTLPQCASTDHRRNLMAIPWVLNGVISPSVVSNNPMFTQLRVDCICDPLQLVLSTQVLTYHVLDTFLPICGDLVALLFPYQ